MAMTCNTTEVTICGTTIQVVILFSYSILQIAKMTEDISQWSLKSGTTAYFLVLSRALIMYHTQNQHRAKRDKSSLSHLLTLTRIWIPVVV